MIAYSVVITDLPSIAVVGKTAGFAAIDGAAIAFRFSVFTLNP